MNNMNTIPAGDDRDPMEQLSEFWAEPEAEVLERARAIAQLDEIRRWQENEADRATGQISRR